MIPTLPMTCFVIIPLILINHFLLAEFISLNNQTDYLSLLAIKSRINADPYDVVLGSWNNSRPFCAWPGVTCGKKHHRVTVLSLSSLGISGSLSPHIGNLTFLKALSLYDNAFQGILPREIGHLSRLRVLMLANNDFQGELPKNLTGLASLSVLNLRWNRLRGRIPNELGYNNNPKLTQIELSNNEFTGKIPPSLGNLSALIHLNVSYNFIEGTIPIELTRLSNLNVFQLSVNNLTGLVPNALYNMTSLVLLSLTSNYLHGQLPPDLFLKLPNLQKLYLGNNSFSGPLPISITNASKLHTIDLFSCNFSGSIPKNLGGRLTDLELLNFGGNKLGTEKGDDLSFITSLVNCTKLRLLWVPHNQLKGLMPNSVANLSAATLTTFRIDQNFIKGIIPEGIGNLVNLQFLALYINELVGEIPESLAKLSNLKECYIDHNSIGGRIPPSLGNLTSLTQLYLSGNKLVGTIPPSLGNCRNLIMLCLAENDLVGEVPQEILALSSLAIGLELWGNNLVGPLPSQVGRLANLGELVLSDNNLYGEIPSTIGNCLVLESLGLRGNRFSGGIPSSLKNLRGLRVLDLSQNNLSGSIPSFLADKLPLLEYLNLSFNMFEGEVPNGGIFRNLSIVTLDGNHKLCGGPSVLQLTPCSQNARKRRRRRQFPWSIVAPVVALSLLMICITILILYRSRKSRKHTNSSPSSTTGDQYPQLSYGDLLKATDGFSSSNILGEGSFGLVYRGVLQSNGNQIIAVKVLKLEEERGASKSFMAECEALRNIRHRNLVKTITSCSSTDFRGNDFKALVFEFIPNGSLEKWLHHSSAEGSGATGKLNLLQRLNISIDVASALNYLHHLCHSPIVHCDLKSSNVLLDNDMSARLSDFGLAKSLIARASQSHSQSSSIAVRGTIGYIAPEYGLGGAVSTLGDVYSFGILLLEMLTGKRPTDSMFVGDFGLREFVARALPEGLTEVVDPTLLNYWEEEENPRRYQLVFEKCLSMVFRLGVACSAALPNERIDIGEALIELHKARDLLLHSTRNRRRR